MVALSTVMLIAGCGGEDSTVRPQQTVTASYDDIVSYRDPVSALFEPEQSIADRDLRRFETIADCMSENGFRYEADQYPGVVTERVFPGDLPPFQREWIEQYGYGVAATVGTDSALTERASQADVVVRSAAEHLAYGEALRDCELRAGPRTFARPEYDQMASTFAVELSDLRERVNSDPRLVVFDEQLARCVEEAGVDHLTPPEAERFFVDKVIEIEESHRGPAGVDWTMPEVQSELDLVLREEVRHALITFDCGGGFIARQSVIQEVTTELYLNFLDQNRGAIDEILVNDS